MAAPELRLNVTLDLASFRSQLGKLAQTAAAYYYPVNLIINKKNLTTQLEAIGRNLGAKKYNINLNDTSVVLAADKVEKLAASLKKLSGSIQIDFKAGGGTKPIGTAMKEMATKLAKESGGDIKKAVAQMVEMRGASPFGSGARSVPGFKSAAKGMGIENAFKLFFQELKQVDPGGLRKALDDGSVMMMKENQEIKQKFDKIQSSAESLAQDLRAMGETAKATGRASLSAGGKTLYPQNYGLKIASLLSQVEKLDKDLRKVSAQNGTELLNNLTELTSILRTTSNSFVGISGFSDILDQTLRGFDRATRVATQATAAYTERINRRSGGPAEATAGPRLLSGRGPGGALALRSREDPYKVIEVQVRNAFDIIEDYHKQQLNNFTSNYKKIIDDYHKAILTQQLINTAQRPAIVTAGTGATRLPGTRIAGLLPPSVGRTPSRYSTAGETTQELFARREREARMRSALRSVDTLREGGVAGRAPSPYSTAYRGARSREAIVPYSAGGALVRSGGGGGGAPPVPPSGGGRGGGSFGGMQFNAPKLPGAGIVQGLGTEFAFAAKQVLLFGTAYKALAFLTDFPSQVGAAVGQLQSFRNTLNAVSPSAQEAAQSSQFILDVVDKYNVPLQSARDGFTRLYASMQPAGFGGNEIRDLFLGISQAAATFGMSADKVDRVNYAFAQMASKGQVMSEELKGQLGDVLPGSMALFAEAAGFKGPQAITKFSKALEDGVYKGGAMKTLLTNVGIVMSKEFGPGAEGAAKTFQGSINRMQNSLKLFYETFEPVAVGFLNVVVTPMTSGIKTLIDGFNAFFTGQAAQTTSGNVLAQQLEQLRPAFDGIRNNITQILPLLQSFGKTALSLGSILLQIAGNPFVGYLARVYLAVLPLTIAIQALNLSALIPLIRNLLAAVPAFVAFTASQLRGMSTLGSFKAATYGLGLTAAATGVKIRLLSGIIKTAFATTVIGVALLGIGMLIEKLMMAGFKADEAKQKMLQFADSVKQAGKAGDVAGLVTTLAEEKGMVKRMQNAKALLEEIKKGKKSISEQQKQELEALGLTSNMAFFQEGGPKNLSKNLTVQVSMFGVLDANIQAAQKGYLEGQTKIIQSQKALNVAKNKQTEEEKELAKIKLEGGDDGKAAEREAERQAKLQDKLANRRDQLEVDAANRRAALDQTSFDSRLRMSEAEYDHQRALQDAYFEREMSGLDSIEARQKKFQQDLKAIEDRRIDSIRKAELDAVKAVQDLRTASIKATAVTGGTPGGAYLQGNIGPTSTGPHFDVKKQGGGFFPRNYLDPYVAVNGAPLSTGTTVPGGTFAAHQARGSHGWDYAFGAGRHAATLKGGAEWMGGVPTAHGEKREFKIPTGEIFSFLHGGSEGINARPISAATRPGAFAMGRREDKAKGQLAVEQEDAQNKALEKLETIRRANNLALEQTITLVKQNIDSIFPVKEQQLENDLLEMRNNLELKGTSKEIIDMEVQKYKAVKENAYNLQALNEKIAKNNEELTKLKGKKITTPEEEEQIKSLTNQIEAYKLAIAGIPEQQRLFNEQLERTAALAVESPMVKLAKQLNETKKELMETSSASSMAIGGAKSIGEAFGSSFKDMISGSKTVKQSIASLFQSVGDYFLDMGSRIISKWIEMQAIQGLMSIFSMFAPGAAAGGVSGAAPAPSNLQPGADFSLPGVISTGMATAANGAVWQGGFTAFAAGGIVQGPTLGLVGEGKYNEAIIPLPDGKSVPVDLGGVSDGLASNITSNIVVNVNSDGQSSSNANGSNSVDLGRKIEGAVKQVIVAELRPGGVLAGRR